MSVIGLDFGTRSSLIAVLHDRKVEVIANEVSLRQTADCVGFTFKQRELGESAFDQFTRNPRNTILGVKALLGRRFNDPTLKQMLRSMGACKWIESSNGNVAVEVSYLGQTKVFTGEQLTAMLLGKLKSISEAATRTGVVACVASVPGWWSHTERTAFLNAAKIAGFPLLRIVNDLSAIAYNYGFYKPNAFPHPTPVLFMDMGYASFGCTVAEMSTPHVKILASAYDSSTGGWEIDQLLADHFAASFNKKNGTCIQDDPRGWLKLLGLVDKAKKTLNMNEQATVAMECISGDADLCETITRDQYHQLLAESGIAPKIIQALKNCLERAGLKASDLHAVEWVGSSLRVNTIRDAIQEFLKDKPLSCTMNAEEAVSIGCCLLCARLSPTSSTRKYDLIENTGRGVSLTYTMGAKEHTFSLFSENYALPKATALNSTFPEARPVSVIMSYSDPSSVSFGNDVIARASVPNVPNSEYPAKLRLTSKAEPFGTFGFVEANLMEEKEAPVEESKDEMQLEPQANQDVEMKEERKIIKTKTPLTLNVEYPGTMTAQQVEAARMDECEMKRADNAVIETAVAKNALEAFVYYAQEQATGQWKEFGSKEEFAALEDICSKTTMWLYDEGSDVTKDEYDKKMEAVKVFSEPIRLRLAAKLQAEEDERKRVEDEKRKVEEEAKKKAEEERKAAEAQAQAEAAAAAANKTQEVEMKEETAVNNQS